MRSDEEKKKEKERGVQGNIFDVILSSPDLVGNATVAVVETIGGVAKTITDNTVVNFLKDKFKLGDAAAHEVSDHLPVEVVDQINEFDGEGGLSEIFNAVADTIRSIELPDVELPNIDFPDIDF